MFGWVDFSEEERQRAFEIMELARIPGAIDELGAGYPARRLFKQALSRYLPPSTPMRDIIS